MAIAYYPGCSLTQSAELYNLQIIKLFNQLDINITEIEDWSCCGSTSAGKVNDFMAVALPARNIGIAETAGFDEIVIPCSACYSRTIVAQKQLEENPQIKSQINHELSKKIKGGIKVSSILEVLLDNISKLSINQTSGSNLSHIKPVCYYGCMLTRFPQDIEVGENVENPQGMEKILKAIGITSLDWNYKTFCCGASAVVNDPETALKLMADIMEDAINRGANCFVTTCPMCQMNLDVQQEEIIKKYNIRKKLPIYYITELLGIAMGMSPKEMQIDKHFIDGCSLLEND